MVPSYWAAPFNKSKALRIITATTAEAETAVLARSSGSAAQHRGLPKEGILLLLSPESRAVETLEIIILEASCLQTERKENGEKKCKGWISCAAFGHKVSLRQRAEFKDLSHCSPLLSLIHI